MTANVTKIISETNSRIAAGGQDIVSAASLAGIVKTLSNNVVSVATIGDLPAAADNKGRLIYVTEYNSYRFSDGTQWTNDFSSAYCVTSSMFVWGYNGGGRLGTGSLGRSFCSPTRERCSATDWIRVGFGDASSFFIKDNGEMYVAGSNSDCNLGLGFTGICTILSPVREFCSATNWIKVEGGYRGWNALKSDGTIWGWGRNCVSLAPRIGDGTTITRISPVREKCSATDWCDLSTSCFVTVALKTDGSLWGWGSFRGNGNTVDLTYATRERCSSTNWCQASVGRRHTSAIKTDGSLWTWGYNSCGQQGNGTITSTCSPVREICSATDWCLVSSSRVSTSAIKTDGSLWSWGGNSCGRLGDGATANSCSPIREFCSATNWCSVSSKETHALALKTDGSLWGWGVGSLGILGNGSTDSRCSPVREFTSATDWSLVFTGIGLQSAGIKITSSKGFL